MAGVGFELKKLFRARTAAGKLKAYSYSAIVTAGPFALLTGMVLAIQGIFMLFGVGGEESQEFVGSVVYAFVFSQIISCGFTMILTRYVADCLSVERYQDVTSSLFGMGAIMTAAGGILASVFFWGKPLEFFTKLLGYLFFAQLMLVWVQSVYLSAVKKYKRLLLSYLAGALLSIGLTALFFAGEFLPSVQGALLAMDIGMGTIVLLFFLHITAHFGLPKGGLNFAFLPYIEKHWRLLAIAMCYTAGIFIPNVIVWQGPWGVTVGGTYRYAPVYDVVTFYAFLSILPLMTLFVVSVETSFYERYQKYFAYVIRKGNFREIDDARKDLLHTLWFEMRHIVEFQLVCTLVFLALGNYFLSWAGITYQQVNMFNVILMGVFFTGVLQVIYILMVYFDFQQDVLKVALSFLVGNLVFGLLGLYWWGESSYGFTFFIAAAVSIVYGLSRLSHFGDRINYFVFCGQPIFYQPPNGPFTRLAKALYGDKLVDMEKQEENR
ncbi:MAG: exopolysaccharide Pel transporter PelG [Selenomonadaceae bacterium]|nr:exopolysaccharide Pel transporter PelG [Selenomonadaceae bacterium]